MRGARTTGTTWIRIGAGLVALALASACAMKTGRRQTDIMEKAGGVSVSAADLRARVNDLADRLTGRVEETADAIRAETQDRAVRRRALTFKMDLVPAIYTAAYRADPLTAAVDVWGLAFQMTHYLEDGAGREAFGPLQPLARECARDFLADSEVVVRGATTKPDAFVRNRARVEGWATEHPIERSFSSRPSIAAFLVEMRSEERDAFVAVGAVSDTIENLAERLNTYAAQLPKQARWQAELLALDMSGEHDVEGAMGDVHALGEAARHADDLLGGMSGMGAPGSPVREVLAAERRAVLEGVNGQRLDTLEYATSQRLAVLAAVREERIAVLAALREERIETLKEVDAIKTRAVDTAVAGLHDLVDYAFWRVAALSAILMLAAATLGVAGYWLTLGRRGRAPGA